MAATQAIFEMLVRLALASGVLLCAATVAVLVISQPARRIRAIEWTLVGLVILPCLMLVPGYPRVAVLPAMAWAPSADRDKPEVAVIAPGLTQDTRSPESSTLVEPRNSLPIDEVDLNTSPSPWTGEDEVAPSAQHPFTEPTVVAAQPLHPAPLPRVERGEDAGQMEPAGELPAATERPARLQAAWLLSTDVRVWIVALYVAGVGAMVLWSLVGLIAVRRLLATARPADDACLALFRTVAGPGGQRVRLMVSPRVAQPCALVWRSFTIVLPASLVARGDEQALRWALAHEWSHVARGDLLSWTASGIVRWFYFYHPLLWWLRGQLQLCQDFVADDAAARAGHTPEDYAEFLTTSSFTRPTLAAGLGIGGRISDLRRRIVMLVDHDRPLETKSPRRWNLAVMPFAIVLVAFSAGLAQQGNRLEAGAARLEEEVADDEPAESEAPEEPALPASDDPFSAPPAEPEAFGEPPAEPPSDEPPAAPPAEDPFGPPAAAGPVSDPVAEAPPEAAAIAEPASAAEAPAAGAPVDPAKPAAKAPKAAKVKTPKSAKPVPAVAPARAVKTGVPTVPAGPRRIEPGDALNLDVLDNLDSLGVKGLRLLVQPGTTLVVDGDGSLSLGSRYGTVDVGGKTLLEAEQAIVAMLLVSIHEAWSKVDKPKIEEALLKRLLDNMQINVRLQFVSNRHPSEKPVKVTAVQDDTFFVVQDGHGPRRVAPGDLLDIETPFGSTGDLQPRSNAQVESDGSLPLGVAFGRVKVGGMTIVEAENAIRKHLEAHVKNANVQVTFHDWSTDSSTAVSTPAAAGSKTVGPATAPYSQQADGRIQPGDVLTIEADPAEADKRLKHQAVVEPDGSIALGVLFGRVQVGGQSIAEAEATITKKVGEQYRDSRVQVTMASFGTSLPARGGAGIDRGESAARVADLEKQIEKLAVEIKVLEGRHKAELKVVEQRLLEEYRKKTKPEVR